MTNRLGRRALFRLALPLAILSPGGLAVAREPARLSRLPAPFSAQAIRARSVAARAAGACPVGGPPLRDVTGTSYYVDSARSVPDPALREQNLDAQAPLREWLALIQRPMEAWLLGAGPEAALCSLQHMLAWAEAEAMLGQANRQGAFNRKWTLAGAAVNFLALRDVPDLPAEPLQRIARWLARVARAVMPVYDRTENTASVTPFNNHAYWAGAAVAASGIAAGDRALVSWGVERARMGLRQVTAEGALPLELRRGQMALSYHLFAVAPLAALERIATVNGMALTAAETAALDRLVALCAQGIEDPSRFAALTGQPQARPTGEDAPSWRNAAGLEIRQATRPVPGIGQALAAVRPVRQTRLGGNITLLWG